LEGRRERIDGEGVNILEGERNEGGKGKEEFEGKDRG
jgi:hypothetical protein